MKALEALALVEGGPVVAEVPPLDVHGEKQLSPVYAFPETAILGLPHVAAWIGISSRQVERLDIPFSLLGKRTKRYLGRDVIEFMEKKRVW
jgi:hypothetical protein